MQFPNRTKQMKAFYRLLMAGTVLSGVVSLQAIAGTANGAPEPEKAKPASTMMLAQMSTPAGQLALQLDRARSAIAQDDSTAAEKALAEVERLSPQAPEIAGLRQALQDAQQKTARRSSHITELLTDMRQAIARHDFAAANRALNEAERIDVRDPSIEPARVELARAQNAEQKRNAQQ